MDSQQKLRGMMEGALLGAVWILLLYLTIYTPLFFVTTLLLPIPLTILTYRQDTKIAGMTLAVFVVLAIVFNLLLVGFSFILYSILTGVVLGYSLRNHKSVTVILSATTVAILATHLSTLLILSIATGYDIMNDFATLFRQSLDQYSSAFGSLGMDSPFELINIDEMIAMLRLMMPTAFIITSVLNAYVYYWIVVHIFRKLGEKVPPLPSLTVLRLPKSILGYYLVSVFGMLILNSSGDTSGFWYLLVFSIVQLLTLALAIQGISVLWFFMKKRKWPSVARIPVLLLLLHPLLFQITSWVGMFDMFFNWRKLLK